MKSTPEDLCLEGATPEELCEDGADKVETCVSFSGWSRSFLYELMDSGLLPYIKQGRTRRIPRRALVKLMASGLRGGKRPGKRELDP